MLSVCKGRVYPTPGPPLPPNRILDIACLLSRRVSYERGHRPSHTLAFERKVRMVAKYPATPIDSVPTYINVSAEHVSRGECTCRDAVAGRVNPVSAVKRRCRLGLTGRKFFVGNAPICTTSPAIKVVLRMLLSDI